MLLDIKENITKSRRMIFTVVFLEFSAYVFGLVILSQSLLPNAEGITIEEFNVFYLLYLLTLASLSYYRISMLKSFFNSIGTLMIASFCMPFIYSFLSNSFGLKITSNEEIIDLMILVFIISFTSRLIFKAIANSIGFFKSKVLFIGDGKSKELFFDDKYLNIKNIKTTSNKLNEDPFFLDEISKTVESYDRIILDFNDKNIADEIALLLSSASNTIEVIREQSRLPISELRYFRGFQTLKIRSSGVNLDGLIKKFFLDYFLVLISIPLWIPIILVCSVLIKIDSPGPIFFKQRRIGFRNRFFYIYKFRSMHQDQTDHDGSKLTEINDKRVTRVGNFLRKTSLDELPQIINVLRFEMSLVGPRPSTTKALAGGKSYWHDFPDYWQRHKMLPGMTGLAQVRGFRGNTFDRKDILQRVEADLEYLQNWSLALDLRILLRTFTTLISDKAF